MASTLTSLEVHPADVPWLTERLARYGQKRPVRWIVATPQELLLGRFIYEPAISKLSDPLVGFGKTLVCNDELRDYLNDWFDQVKGEYHHA